MEYHFIGLLEESHRSPKYPKTVRLQVASEILLGIPFFKKTELISFSMLWEKSQRRHPFSVLMERIREAIVCDSSRCLSERTFMRMMTRIMKISDCK
jgi:hypothetical protein